LAKPEDDSQMSEQNDEKITISKLKAEVNKFVEERDWAKFHNPKDLAESICIESAELLQLFQWIKPEESEQFNSRGKKERDRSKACYSTHNQE
jgi:NTP pyrophosphatase (non-canonical NTP hydrolase)